MGAGNEREVAAIEVENLHRTYQEEGLEAAMRRAEGLAVANGELNADRVDGRLFTDGPPDRFTTTREVQLLGVEDVPVGEPIRDITNDETQELPAVSAPEPGSWDELVAHQTDDEPEPERHYWQTHYRPVETPDGRKVGDGAVRDRVPAASARFRRLYRRVRDGRYGLPNGSAYTGDGALR